MYCNYLPTWMVKYESNVLCWYVDFKLNVCKSVKTSPIHAMKNGILFWKKMDELPTWIPNSLIFKMNYSIP